MKNKEVIQIDTSVANLIKRHYTKEGETYSDVLKSVKWSNRHVEIKNNDGNITFAGDVSFPESWSDNAVNITASRYFYRGSEYFENSLGDLITRVVTRLGEWLHKQHPKIKNLDAEITGQETVKNIFMAELAYILLYQIAAFNSPVFFNLGISKKTKTNHSEVASACYITSIDDNMESIKEFQNIEFEIFKSGAGNGANFSKLRGSVEHIKGGGTSSGPISFMEAYDTWGGRIRSGGRLRRAAIMRILDVDHPDIETFIASKTKEELKARTLMNAGFSGGIDGEAYRTVAFQNENHSVRVDDEFMECAINDKEYCLKYRKDKSQNGSSIYKTIKAKKVLYDIAKAVHFCGDPGIHFKSTINRYNTIPNTGEIESSNPCLSLDSHVLTNNGFKKVKQLLHDGQFIVLDKNGHEHKTDSKGVFLTQENAEIYKVIFSNGLSQKFTGNHKFKLKDGSFKSLLEIDCNEQLDDMYNIPSVYNNKLNITNDQVIYFDKTEYEKGILTGWFFGDGSWIHNSSGTENIGFAIGEHEFDCEDYILNLVQKYIDSSARVLPHFQKPNSCHIIKVQKKSSLLNAKNIGIPEYKETFDITSFSNDFKLGFLRGLVTTDGSIRRNGAVIEIYSQYKEKLEDFLRVILEMGGYGTLSVHGHARSYIAKDGKQRNNNTCYKIQCVNKFTKLILMPISNFKKASINLKNDNIYTNRYAKIFIRNVEEAGYEDVYDITVPDINEFICGGGCIAHNCSEVFNINNTSCNLASINLIKFLGDTFYFDFISLKHVVNIMTISQDTIVDNADYPHKTIAEGTKNTRNLGLGVTNLGNLLMQQCLPYDSDAARYVSSIIIGYITSIAYLTSYIIGTDNAPFPEFEKNRNEMANTLSIHAKYMATSFVPSDLTSLDAQATKLLDNIQRESKNTLETIAETIKNGTGGMANCFVTACAPAGCLTENTLILTDSGLKRITNIGDKNGPQWQDIDINVISDNGPKKATKFFVNGVANTISIKTNNGYEISGTLNHKIKIVDENNDIVWKQLSDIKENDIVPIYIGGLVGNPQIVQLKTTKFCKHGNCNDIIFPREMTPELSELIGFYMANGSMHKKSLRFHVYEKDVDVINRLVDIAYKLFHIKAKTLQSTGCVAVYLNSLELINWWSDNGFAKLTCADSKYIAYIPKNILDSNDKKIYCSFLRGLFTADGSVTMGLPSLSNKDYQFMQDISCVCATVGYPFTKYAEIGGISQKPVYKLTLSSGFFCNNWKEDIGFSCQRKQNKLKTLSRSQNNIIPISKKYIYNLIDYKENSKLHQQIRMSLHRHNYISRNAATEIYRLTNDKLLEQRLQYFYTKVKTISTINRQPTYDISVPENMTYIANGMISHNTISFMMDATTTGIEPELALLKFKSIVGGGTIKIVNNAISATLKKLNFQSDQIQQIKEYILEHGTIEGAPYLSKASYPIFASSFGTPRISPEGHLKMVAALQPVVSQGISRTINMPESATIEDIMNIYIDAWKMGLKCISIYRDNSKMAQPLTTKQQEDEKNKLPIPKPTRKRLPMDRASITHKFSIGNIDGYLTVGLYEDGKPGEIFITMAKIGTFAAGIIDCFATSVSMGLQYGVPLPHYIDKFKGTKFDPNGITQNPEIQLTSSVIDYIGKWLENRFIKQSKDKNNELIDVPKENMVNQYSYNICHNCGGLLERAGTCEVCTVCGETTGCS